MSYPSRSGHGYSGRTRHSGTAFRARGSGTGKQRKLDNKLAPFLDGQFRPYNSKVFSKRENAEEVAKEYKVKNWSPETFESRVVKLPNGNFQIQYRHVGSDEQLQEATRRMRTGVSGAPISAPTIPELSMKDPVKVKCPRDDTVFEPIVSDYVYGGLEGSGKSIWCPRCGATFNNKPGTNEWANGPQSLTILE